MPLTAQPKGYQQSGSVVAMFADDKLRHPVADHRHAKWIFVHFFGADAGSTAIPFRAECCRIKEELVN